MGHPKRQCVCVGRGGSTGQPSAIVEEGEGKPADDGEVWAAEEDPDDFVYEGGISNMRYTISNTAQFGDVTRGPRVVDEQVKREMRKILSEIQTGEFAREWLLETRSGKPVFNALTRRGEEHPLEAVGRQLRSLMPFLNEGKLVDRSRN